MPVESIQCPKCGSPLQVESTAKAVTCGYCGSRVRITTGVSGHLLGVLDDIKVDTEVIAKQTAIDHLSERLSLLLEAHSALSEWYSWSPILGLRARRLDPRLDELGELRDSLDDQRRGIQAQIQGIADATVAEGMRNRAKSANLSVLGWLLVAGGGVLGIAGICTSLATEAGWTSLVVCSAPCFIAAASGLLLLKARTHVASEQQLFSAGWAHGAKQYGSGLARVEEETTRVDTSIGTVVLELLASIEDEIGSTQARISTLKRDMDRLAREL